VGRRRYAGAGGGNGVARELSTVETRTKERGGKEPALIGWHSGVGAQWLARDHVMGRLGAEPTWRQRSRVAAPRPSGERGTGSGSRPCFTETKHRHCDDEALGALIGGWTWQ
jgi:hypothetical protein